MARGAGPSGPLRPGRSACLGVMAWAAFTACGSEPAPAPSFVLVLADDLGWADVGYEGSRFHHTPEIDRLAADGLVFSQAYSASPVCSPSRAALVSGLAPARLHLTTVVGANTPTAGAEEREVDLGEGALLIEPTVVDRLPEGVPTLASRLVEQGYRTGWIGKWHLGGRPGESGFETVLADSSAGATASYFSPYGIATLPDGPPGEYLTDRLTDEAVRFLEENRARPFLLVLSHYAPHLPLQAPPALVAEYQARADPAAPQHNPVYAAMVERLDASLGRVRATLERLGLAEHTLLVFTSDNGGFEEKRIERQRNVVGRVASSETMHITSNRPLRGGKGRVYEGGVRVPLVAWGGPTRRSGTCAVPVVGMDFAPTFLALAGAAPLPVSDGLDFTPLLARETPLARETLAFHFPHQASESALRRGDEKLVYAWATDQSELFDLAADLSEAHDLASERPARTAELRAELFAWLDSVGAGRPRRKAISR